MHFSEQDFKVVSINYLFLRFYGRFQRYAQKFLNCPHPPTGMTGAREDVNNHSLRAFVHTFETSDTIFKRQIITESINVKLI